MACCHSCSLSASSCRLVLYRYGYGCECRHGSRFPHVCLSSTGAPNALHTYTCVSVLRYRRNDILRESVLAHNGDRQWKQHGSMAYTCQARYSHTAPVFVRTGIPV